MSRPWKRPDRGVFWLRKGVPEDLRKIVGKREEKRSLQPHMHLVLFPRRPLSGIGLRAGPVWRSPDAS
jgi:hypothetical protein